MTSVDASSVFLVDKPLGPTCRELLDELEDRLDLRPLGHAGTLDPLASGVLLVLTGAARRLQELFVGSEKTYEASIVFGATSATDDAEGPFTTGAAPIPAWSDTLVSELVSRFLGVIAQSPPARSAVRVLGRRAHELAREGTEVALAPRHVRIYAIEVLHVGATSWDIRVRTGPGTYIRSLARDLGAAAGCGGYVSRLRRTQSGPFCISDAVPAAQLQRSSGLSFAEALRAFPALLVQKDEAEALRHGRTILAPLLEVERTLAWFEGQPLCRLSAPSPGVVRSLRWIADPGLFMR